MSILNIPLNDFSNIKPDETTIEYLDRTYGKDLTAKELQLELEAYTSGEQRFLKQLYRQIESNEFAENAVAKPLLATLIPKFIIGWNNWVKQTSTKRGQKPIAYVLLNEASAETIAAITIKVALMYTAGKDAQKIQNVSMSIGKEIEDEIRFSRLKDVESKYLKEYIQTGLNKRSGKLYKKAFARAMENLTQREGLSKDPLKWNSWSNTELVHCGLKCLEILIGTTQLVEINRNGAGNFRNDGEYVYLSDEYSKLLMQRAISLAGISPMFQPMVLPPKDWNDIKGGGYWSEGNKPLSFIRVHSKEHLKRYEGIQMPKVYSSINLAQKTAWRVNENVLEVLNKIKHWKHIPNDIIPSEDMEELPIMPDDVDINEVALKEWKKEASMVYKRRKARVSKRLALEFIIDQAIKFSKYDKIYFPMNLDWRGRVYAIPYFNPQGNDVSKGLLTFAERKPIGEKGFYWLKIHGANTAGVDKVDFNERIKFIEDNHNEIIKIANDPLSNLWWTELDSPFCFLAFCFEYANVVQYGFTYECSLPISFDGSCSGIQHFSAMLRDEIGGNAVNLVPQDKVQDIYQMVADKLIVVLQNDVENGTDDNIEVITDETTGEITEKLVIGTKTIASNWLKFGITRKITKRCVMTLPYGAMEYGFSQQILEDTIDPAIMDNKGELFGTNGTLYARYLARNIWVVVNETVVAATSVMEWLKNMVKIASQPKRGSKDKPKGIYWRTPDNFRVWQSYKVFNEKRIDLVFLGKARISATIQSSITSDKINTKKQVSGIAPNFVHSMDGCHLRNILLFCNDKYNIKSFALIHDSFGTLPADANNLFKGIRETFVYMYENNDVLQDFYADVLQQVINPENVSKLPVIPPKGNLDLKQVVNSNFAFA